MTRATLPKQAGRASRGFTLLEIVLASTAAALILIAVYSIFFRAVRMRDDATERTREARLRARAVSMIRNDLRNGFLSGGILAASLEGGVENSRSSFPGHLRFTTTSAHTSPEELAADVQEVEYYVATDPDAVSRNAGVLVRAVDHDLLTPLRTATEPERVLNNVASLEVSFFDGSAWTSSWAVSAEELTVPKAVRVRIVQGPPEGKAPVLPPLEIVVPWTVEPQMAPTETATSPASTP